MTTTLAEYSTISISSGSIVTVPDTATSSGLATSSTTSSSTSSTSRYSTSSSGVPTVTSTSFSTATSSSESPPAASTGDFTFLQISGDQYWSYNQGQVDDADFKTLCPLNGSCYDSCSDFSLLMNKDSYVFDETSNTNISSVAAGSMTLFGICSNIANITEAVGSGDMPKSETFFPKQNALAEVQGITLNTTLCLFDTCQATRDPSQCEQDCFPATVLTSETTMDIAQTRSCLYRLCSNTCGLPDANQDVFGIGVLISYITQAVLVIICAAGILASSAYQIIKYPSRPASMPESWKDGLSTFLAAECYFGVSSVIASYSMDPMKINPLDGYALLSVAITAFMPPVFTLMLLHHKGQKSWWATSLVLVSWLTASILFFMLLSNLSSVSNSSKRLAEARNSLFQVDSCGGFSAMSLCQENMHNDPLKYLTMFYNKQSLPNIKTVILLWLWTTVVLAVLQCRQIFSGNRTQSSIPTKPTAGWRGRLSAVSTTLDSAMARLIIVLLASLIFGLAFGYQAQMVIQYFQMDVVNKHDWSFGQWVAVLFWIPPLIDFIRRLFTNVQPPTASQSATAGTGVIRSTTVQVKRKPLPSSSSSSYQPLAHSPLPTPKFEPFDASSPFEPLRHPSRPQPTGEDFELRRVRRQTTVALESGT